MKVTIDNEADLNALPEPVRGEYVKNAEGKYVLNLDGNVVPRSQLEEMRNNNLIYLKARDEAQAELKKFENINLDDYTRLKGIEQDLTDQKLVKREGLDALVTKKAEEMSGQMKKEMETKLAASLKNNETLLEKLATLTIDQEVSKAAEQLGVRANAIQFIKSDIRARARMENGQPVLYKPDGSKDYNAETKNKSIAEAVDELVKASPFLLEGNEGGGSSNQSQHRGPTRGSETNWWKKETFNLTKQMELVKKNPQLATQLKQEAGLSR